MFGHDYGLDPCHSFFENSIYYTIVVFVNIRQFLDVYKRQTPSCVPFPCLKAV